MPRRRKQANQNLPKGVYKARNGGYQYIQDGRYIGMVGGRDASLSEIYARLDELKADASPFALKALIKAYKASPRYAKRKPATIRCYGFSEAALLPVFGDNDCRKLKTHHIQTWYDERHQYASSRVNKELAFLSVVFSNAIRRGWMESNPCQGVEKMVNDPRKRYITDSEYEALLTHANPMMKAAIELAYLTGLRMTDIRALTWSQVKPEIIEVTQSKTGVEIGKVITPAVDRVLKDCKRMNWGIKSLYVIHTRQGQPYSEQGFSAIFRRTRAAAGLEDLQFKDLRRKGATDYQGRAMDFTGHTDDRIANKHYDMKKRKSPSLDK